MITQYGMSEALGPLTFGHDAAQPFVGRDYGMGQEYSDAIAEKIDVEIRRVVDEAYDMAIKLLTEHRDELDKMSLLLMDKETIDREEFEALLAGTDPEEVFRARDEARARKAAESKRVQRPRRVKEQEEVDPGVRETRGDGRGHADVVARRGLGQAFSWTGPRSKQAVRLLLEGIGEDPDREGLVDTPRRVADFYEEIIAAESEDLSSMVAPIELRHPSGDGPRAGHRLLLHMRASSCSVLRGGARGLHPFQEREHHRHIQDRPLGAHGRWPASVAGTTHQHYRRHAGPVSGSCRACSCSSRPSISACPCAECGRRVHGW